MRVTDIMSRPVHTVHIADTIETAAALLADKQITAAPVLDVTGELVGMVSEGDLLWRRVPEDPTAYSRRNGSGVVAGPRPKLVVEVMSMPPVTAAVDADVADVAGLMVHHDVHSVPIVDDGEVVGIVSRRDILRTFVRTDDVLGQEVQHRLDDYAGGVRRWAVRVRDGNAMIEGHFDDGVERAVVGVMARTVPGIAAVGVSELVA